MRISSLILSPAVIAAGLKTPGVLDHPCVQAQIESEGLDRQKLSSDMIKLTEHSDEDSFYSKKPTVTDSYIEVESLYNLERYRLACKFKNRDIIERKMNRVLADKPVQPCSLASEKLINQSIPTWNPAIKKRLEENKFTFKSVDDVNFTTGIGWKNSDVSFTQQGQEIQIEAKSLRTPWWVPVLGGMRYCKTLSVTGAQALVLALSPSSEIKS